MSNRLYYGDNLDILREHVADESVDLIYLDPPFNSKRDYNLLFKTPKGQQSDAQITAFDDTWHWGPQAEAEFHQILKGPNTDVAEMMQALRKFLGENDMMAYLTMIANRLLQLQRVLKSTGSLYLHCDPTASHYLKVVLDGVFGKINCRNEISWKRSSAHSDTKQGMKRYGKIRDIIFFYTKSDGYAWTPQYTPYDETYLEQEYRHLDSSGRRYKEADLTAAKPGGDVEYGWRVKRKLGSSERWQEDLADEFRKPKKGWEYLEVRPYSGRYWAYGRKNLIDFANQGKLIHRETGMPRLKLFADEMPGVSLQDSWDDISPASGDEDLGYPTQKPIALLERIIRASSKEGDIVLDPFCGCGTAVHAAQKLGRQWIGIDVTHLAISLIEKRMKNAFPYLQVVSPGTKKAAQVGPNAFEVVGVPRDIDGARDMFERDPHQFQLWACTLVGAQPYKGGRKGADSGIDGLVFPEVEKGKMEKVIVSVKGGKNVGVAMVRDLKGVIQRDKAAIGLFVTLTPPTKEMIKEAASAGFYESPLHGDYPCLQILTVEGLLEGKESAKFPDMAYGGQTFKKAKAENKTKDQGKLF
ncbi:MAG TPA: DNA methyltransferase [Burkholderiales bacterium]|nr:DNA methyltransferase [Burkholderiales bacterium]